MQEMPEYEKIEIRPMNLGDIVNRTFSLFGKHFLKLAIIVAIGSIFSWIYSIWMGDQMMAMFESFQDLQNVDTIERFSSYYDDIGNMIGLNILAVVSSIFSVWMVGSLTHMISVVHFEGMPVVSHSLKRGTQKLLKMIGVGLLLIIVLMVPFIVLLVSLIMAISTSPTVIFIILFMFLYIFVLLYLEVRMVFIIQAVFVEDLGVIDSIKRSWKLTSGNWWRLVGYAMLAGIFSSAVTFTVGLIPYAGTIISSLVGTPIMIIFLTLIYWNIRSQKETLSLEQIQSELDTSDPEPGLPQL